MTTSASTPRLRVTLLWYLCLLLLTAVTRSAPLPVSLRGVLDVLALLSIVAACLGRVWCSVFIAGRKDAELVTNGPYALCRHPLYTLSLLGGVGLGLATHSLTLTMATLLVQGVLFSRSAREEERFMTARFDVRYERYREQTPQFWPRRWPTRGWRSFVPETLEVRPLILWKSFVDAGSFALLYALVNIAVLWRDFAGLPKVFVLP